MTFGTVDLVRLKIGDTGADMHLSDEEIQRCIDDWPDNVDLAAANAAEAVAAVFADDFDFQTDGQVFNRSSKFDNWMKKAETLRARGGVLESS